MAWALIPIILEIRGIAAAIHALRSVRTDRLTIAGCIALVSLPVFALRFYVVFGRTRFDRYRRAIREAQDPHEDQILEIQKQETVEAIFEGIRRAERYVLVQFYTIKDDGLGRRMRDALVERAKTGLSVRFLYDEFGSSQRSDSYLQSLEVGGVEVAEFDTRARRGSRFEIEGPAVKHCQMVTMGDWHWTTGELPEVHWQIPALAEEASDPQSPLLLPSGTSHKIVICSLAYLTLINAARERCWIASPYFAPDEAIRAALMLPHGPGRAPLFSCALARGPGTQIPDRTSPAP